MIGNLAPVRCVTELGHITGLGSYYRKFITHFSDVAKPPTELKKRTQLFTGVPFVN